MVDPDPDYVDRLGQWRERWRRACELARDIRDGFTAVTLDVPGMPHVHYPASTEDGLRNIATIIRDHAASVLIRAAYRVADNAIVLERRDPDSIVPRNVAVALGADALSYAALDEVETRYRDLYEGSEDYVARDPR